MESGRLLPESYINPTLPRYVAWPLVALHARVAEAGLLPGTLGDPLRPMRLLSAVVAVAAVFLLARGAGRLAGALLAFFPLVVNLAHFATPEPFLVLGATATLLLAVAHARGQAPAWAVGAALGLTASSKYTAAALLPAALLATVWRPQQPTRRDRVALLAAGLLALTAAVLLASHGDTVAARLHLPDTRLLQPHYARDFVGGLTRAAGLGGAVLLLVAFTRRARQGTVVMLAVALLAFLAGTPGALLEPVRFLSDLAYNHQTRFEYKGLVAASSAWSDYARLLLQAGGWIPPVLAVGGLLLAVRRRTPETVLPGLTLAVTYVMVASAGHVALRFLAPALPAMAWLAARALDTVPAPRRRAAVAVALALPALLSVLVVRLFFVDARERAGTWLARNTPPGATIDVIANDLGYAPSVPAGRVPRQLRSLSREMAPADVFTASADRHAEEGAPWLVLTGAYYQRFLDHPGQRPERTAFFERLLAGQGGYVEAARFRQPTWLRPETEFLDPEVVIMTKRPAQPPTK